MEDLMYRQRAGSIFSKSNKQKKPIETEETEKKKEIQKKITSLIQNIKNAKNRINILKSEKIDTNNLKIKKMQIEIEYSKIEFCKLQLSQLQEEVRKNETKEERLKREKKEKMEVEKREDMNRIESKLKEDNDEDFTKIIYDINEIETCLKTLNNLQEKIFEEEKGTGIKESADLKMLVRQTNIDIIKKLTTFNKALKKKCKERDEFLIKKLEEEEKLQRENKGILGFLNKLKKGRKRSLSLKPSKKPLPLKQRKRSSSLFNSFNSSSKDLDIL